MTIKMGDVVCTLAGIALFGLVGYTGYLAVEKNGPNGKVEKLSNQVEKNELDLGEKGTNCYRVTLNGKTVPVRLNCAYGKLDSGGISYNIGETEVSLNKECNGFGGFEFNTRVGYNGEEINDKEYIKLGYDKGYSILEKIIEIEKVNLAELKKNRTIHQSNILTKARLDLGK